MIVLALKDRQKMAQFATIIQLIKSFSDFVTFTITRGGNVQIQVMDKSHICICNCRLTAAWFDNAQELTAQTVTIQPQSFRFSSKFVHSIITTIKDGQRLLIKLDQTDSDTVAIEVLHDTPNKDAVNLHSPPPGRRASANALDNSPRAINTSIDINRFYQLPLTTDDQDILTIPDTEYNVELTTSCKSIADILSQMAIFSTGVHFKCTVDMLTISSADDVNGKMTVDINTDDLDEFSIDDDFELSQHFSLSHILKYGLTTGLVPNIKWSLSSTAPMKLRYELADTLATVDFYISPQISDDD